MTTLPTGLRGPAFLAGSASVEQLQQALTNLAIATGRPAINPGKVTGVVDDQTMVAINAGMGLLTEELPNWLFLALQAAMIVGATSSTAKKYVEQYAAQLTIAANTAAVKFKTTTPVVPTTFVAQPTGLFATLFPVGWYTRPSWGWLVVGGALFGGYKLLTKKGS